MRTVEELAARVNGNGNGSHADPDDPHGPCRVVNQRLKQRVEHYREQLALTEQALAAAQVDISNLEVDLRVKRAQLKKAMNDRDRQDRADPSYEMCFKIWEFWKKHCKPKARKFSHEDFKAVRARLADTLDDEKEPAYNPRYICCAILGAKYAPHVNDKGEPYNELELICRPPKKLENFFERYVTYCKQNGKDLPTGV